MNIPSKQAIVEVASTSGNRDKLYSYVANENDHTVYDFVHKMYSLSEAMLLAQTDSN